MVLPDTDVRRRNDAPVPLLDMLYRLLLAVAAGGLVGIERERRDRPAGLRTHILVCVGSTLFTLVSVNLASDSVDRTRIASNIVTGIGFLGAGTIFRAGAGVRGLTTAAGLWVVAGIGMAIGAGGDLLIAGLVCSPLMLAVNHYLRVVEDRLVRSSAELTLTLSRRRGALLAVFDALERVGARVQNVRWLSDDAEDEQAVLRLRLRLPSGHASSSLTSLISEQEGVRQVEWD